MGKKEKEGNKINETESCSFQRKERQGEGRKRKKKRVFFLILFKKKKERKAKKWNCFVHYSSLYCRILFDLAPF